MDISRTVPLITELIRQHTINIMLLFSNVSGYRTLKMPSNSDFTLDILVDDTPIPEYSKDGENIVECNFETSISRKIEVTDLVKGQCEIQVNALLLHAPT